MRESPPAIRVVEAGEEDIPAISRLFWAMWREAGPDAPGFSGATEQVIAEIAEHEAIRARLGGPERRIFVAYQNETAVGFAATRALDADTVELAGIVVLQSMTGRGIGTPLVETAIRTSRDLGYSTMTVSTEIDNERALDFYRARGFRTVGESTREVEGKEFAVSNLCMEL